jgi:hypothetical protein
MYDILTRLRDEFEPLRAQLLAHHPCVSLMDSLAEIRNDVTHLEDANLLWSSSILVAHFSVACPIAPVPLGFALVAPPAARGESVSLHCDQCGRDGHVEAFCYRKEAQTRRSSQGTGGSSSGGSERSYAGSEIQELLMLLCHLAASTSSGAAGSVTQPFALTGFTIASQSSALGPPSTPSLILDILIMLLPSI